MKIYLNSGELPNKDTIVQIMKRSNLYKVDSEETYKRRASTVRGWLNWIVSRINN